MRNETLRRSLGRLVLKVGATHFLWGPNSELLSRTCNRRRAGSAPATHRHRQGVTLLPRQANHVLPQEVERDGEQNDILHQEGHIARHRRETSRGDVPALRHERNDGDRCDNVPLEPRTPSRLSQKPSSSRIRTSILRRPGNSWRRHGRRPGTATGSAARADGLERDLKVFNRLEGSVCTTCAPGDLEKSTYGKLREGSAQAAASAVNGRPVPTMGDLLERWGSDGTPAPDALVQTGRRGRPSCRLHRV